MKPKVLFGFCTVLLLCGVLNSNAQTTTAQPRDGKLLRGELWEPFVYTSNADFYVSTKGNDAWSGTLPDPNADGTDGPFATIQRVQIAVKALKSQVYKPKEAPVEKRWIGSPHPYGKGRDIVVYIREGFYELKEPLLFTPEDGGERIETNLPSGAFEYHKLKDHYVTYAAFPGEKPVISGGPLLKGWKKKGKVWISNNLSYNVTMLLADGETQTLARTPNKGYFIPPKISKTTDQIYFNQDELQSWNDMQNNRVIMLLRWHTGINSIGRIDQKAGIAWLKNPEEGVVIVPPRYYVEDVKALLDTAGEWFYDRQRKEVSYIPSGSNDPSKMNVSIPQINQLLVIKGEPGKPVRNLRFYGLTFEGVQPGGTAISLQFAHACELMGGNLRSMGGEGVSVLDGCYQTRIMHNIFQTIDNMAIYVHGPEEPGDSRAILRETIISYNQIRDCGGVNIQASFALNTTIAHNYITKTRGRYAISVGGWRNLEETLDGGYTVEYNHLDDVQKDADDSGAIKTAGITFNSTVRKNLIHDVRAGYFNDNVGFWFDNMSLNWVTEYNIFYNLEQGEMKLCAANLVDNQYRYNYVIEAPQNAPEMFIDGSPEFICQRLSIRAGETLTDGSIVSGSEITISADVANKGATGISEVVLYLDGKVHEIKNLPVVHNNTRKVNFNIRIYNQGPHQVAIGDTPYQSIRMTGEKPVVVFEDMKLSDPEIIEGENVLVSAIARNLTEIPQTTTSKLYLNNKVVDSQDLKLAGLESKPVVFELNPESNRYEIRIGNSSQKELLVKDYTEVDIKNSVLSEYCSAKAKPYKITSDQQADNYIIEASGSDFFHAEDSYATLFLEQVKGDFVCTVRINHFGPRTHEWFRAGIFARNDLTKSFDTQPGSKGSMLVFGTPGRAGIEYDEFGNGCMHKANSENLPENVQFPIWLKLIRHGNSFTGAISLDGENWIREKRSSELPGLGEVIDLGLAAGAPDKTAYKVEFDEWNLKVAR